MADQHVLFDSQLCAAPFTDGLVARSVEVLNNNAAYNSAKLVMQYLTINPDGKDSLVGFNLTAVVEEEIASGVWVPQAIQFDNVKGTDEAENQVIELSPTINFNPGTPEKQFSGNKEVASISRSEGTAGEKLRVSVYVEIADSSRAQLVDVTINGYMRQYNT